MKNRLRIFAVLLCAVLLFALMPTVSVASGEADFVSLVNSIDKEGSYAERLAVADAASDAYEKLSAEKKNELSAEYALLAEELLEIGAIKGRAEAFLLKLDELADCTSLISKLEVIDAAMADGLRFEDKSYPGVTEAYETIKEIENCYECCIGFLEAVDELREVSPDDYPTLRAIINEAEAYLIDLDRSYPGISGAYNNYSAIKKAVSDKEKYTAGVIAELPSFDEEESYAGKKALYERITSSTENESFLLDYKGAQTVLEKLGEVKKYLTQCESRGAQFILLVNQIYSADNRFSAISDALRVAKTVDSTVAGVEDAMDSLEEVVSEYNERAEEVNALFTGK